MKNINRHNLQYEHIHPNYNLDSRLIRIHPKHTFAVLLSSLISIMGCGDGDKDSISCNAEEVVSGESCTCDNTNGYYGVPGSCTKCEGSNKVIKENQCVCADNYEDDGNGGCKTKDTNKCGENEIENGGKCICDNPNGYYGASGSCAKCKGSHKVIKENQCICADNYEDDGNGECKAKDTNKCGENEIENGGKCVCDNPNGYYGVPGSCVKCEGSNKVIKENQCVCADNYEDDGNGECKAKDTNKCGENEIENGDKCICDKSNNYYGEPGSCTKCEGSHKVIKENQCICADNYEEDGNGGCKAKDTNKCGENEIESGGKCVCDKSNNYYGEPGSCTKCEGSHKVIKENQCICADNYEDDGNGGCKTKDTNKCGENEIESGGKCVCDESKGYYGASGSCVLCSGTGKIYAAGTCGCDSANGWITGNGDSCICNTDAGWTGNKDTCTCDNIHFGDQCTVKGQNVTFGKYPQATNTSEPIEWIVLEVIPPTLKDKGRILLLSKYVIDARAFDSKAAFYPGWEKSEIRAWLNDKSDSGFLSSASFSEQEISKILEITNSTSYILITGKEYKEETQEKVFLLTIEDLENTAYFANDEARRPKATSYAIQQGALIDTSEGTNGNCTNIQCTSFWWLRSPYPISDPKPQPPYVGALLPACVYEDGIAGETGPNDDRIGVRPALWVQY